ncbi:MAG: WXG100 family type VII secretion target [Mycobacterium sp.]|nr:MAG: WXG100 family type VII secretion target [Mycobacterium sp.]
MSTNGGNVFHVDLNALRSAAELFDKFEKSTEQFLGDVERKVNAMHIDWQGATAAAHLEAQRRWTAGAEEMRSAVRQLRAIVATAHGNYSSAAAANTAMWQRS